MFNNRLIIEYFLWCRIVIDFYELIVNIGDIVFVFIEFII